MYVHCVAREIEVKRRGPLVLVKKGALAKSCLFWGGQAPSQGVC